MERLDIWLNLLEKQVKKLNKSIKRAKRKDVPDLEKKLNTHNAEVTLLYQYIEQHRLHGQIYYRKLFEIEKRLEKATKRVKKKNKPAWLELLSALSRVHKRIAKIFNYWKILEKIPLLKSISDWVSDFIDSISRRLKEVKQKLLPPGK